MISLLLDQPPLGLSQELIDPKAVPPNPPAGPIGLPSELARRRPDIRVAKANLHAANANIGVAVAEFYPSVRLNGSPTLQALSPKDLAPSAPHHLRQHLLANAADNLAESRETLRAVFVERRKDNLQCPTCLMKLSL